MKNDLSLNTRAILLTLGGVLSIISLTALITYKLCNKGIEYTQSDMDAILKQQADSKIAYEDSIEFIKGHAELQSNANLAHTARIIEFEKTIDELVKKHEVTKKKVKPFFDTSGTHAMLVPPEYVDECETCFHKLTTYKLENIQLRFERDSYDTIMRNQNNISEARVQELEDEKLAIKKKLDTCQMSNVGKVTRKLKLSAMGQLNDLFLPKGGGPGLIYEDRKSNEYGVHVLFTSSKKMYMFHIAKTISLRRKK